MSGLPSLYTIFFLSFTVAFVGAASPGPLLIVTITKSLREGIKTPFIVVSAHGVLELVMLTILLFTAQMISHNNFIVSLIGIIGGIVLGYLGYGMWRSEGEKKDEEEKTGHSFILGAIATLSNPYWYLWWFAIGLNFLLMGVKRGILGVAFFFIGHILADLVWYLFVGAITVGGRKKLERYERIITQVGGIILIFIGAYFFASGSAWLR
jgi:threonine/homoserine/homoserine lactone efflux protein